MGFESYLRGGSGMEDCGPSSLWEESPLEYNYEEIKQLLRNSNDHLFY